MTGLCLWAGTLAGHDLWTRVAASCRAGYGSLSVAPAELAAVAAAGDRDRLADALAAGGLELACLDPVVAWVPEAVAAHPAHRVHATYGIPECLDLAEEFGVGLINAIDVTWRALPPAAADGLVDLAARARRRGIAVVVEAQLYSGVPTLAAALDVCRAAGQDVLPLLDTWHLGRHPATRLADLPDLKVGALQLADGPARPGADLVAESTTGRLLPGRGCFDLAGAVRAVRPGAPVGPEVFTVPVRARDTAGVAAAALAATRDVLQAAGRPVTTS